MQFLTWDVILSKVSFLQILPKVIIHKLCGEQFLWNRNWDLGWFWVGWQYWKKMGGRLWVTFEGCFFMFSGAKKMSNFFQKYCSVRTKKLHKMKLKKFMIFKMELSPQNFHYDVLYPLYSAYQKEDMNTFAKQCSWFFGSKTTMHLHCDLILSRKHYDTRVFSFKNKGSGGQWHAQLQNQLWS